MALPKVSDEALRERISGYLHPENVPPITNSTRSLLNSKLTICEKQQDTSSCSKTVSASPSTPQISTSFKNTAIQIENDLLRSHNTESSYFWKIQQM